VSRFYIGAEVLQIQSLKSYWW